VWVIGALLPVAVVTPISQGFDVIAIATSAAAVLYGFTPRILANLRH
jgi:hypothetical protein